MADERERDDLDAARGIVWACLASAALWAVVVIALSLARGAG